MEKRKLLWIDDMLVGDSCLRKAIEQVEGILYQIPEHVELSYVSQHDAAQALQDKAIGFVVLDAGWKEYTRTEKGITGIADGLSHNFLPVVQSELPFVITSCFRDSYDIASARTLVDIIHITDMPLYLNKIFKNYF